MPDNRTYRLEIAEADRLRLDKALRGLALQKLTREERAAIEALRVRLHRLPLEVDEVAPGEFSRAILAGYDVEPDGFRGGWRARDPEGEELPGPDGLGEDPHPTERAAWEACDRHRMFGDVIAPAMRNDGPTP